MESNMANSFKCRFCGAALETLAQLDCHERSCDRKSEQGTDDTADYHPYRFDISRYVARHSGETK